MIKYSKKLNKLLDQLSTSEDDDFNYDFDLVYEVDADCFAMTNEDKCRVDHFDSAIMDGVNLVTKSLKTKKPIYCGVCNMADIIVYWVDNLASIQKKLKAKIVERQKAIAEDEEKELEELEEKVQKLKAKRK